jgi:hypothetical protein
VPRNEQKSITLLQASLGYVGIYRLGLSEPIAGYAACFVNFFAVKKSLAEHKIY